MGRRQVWWEEWKILSLFSLLSKREGKMIVEGISIANKIIQRK
jgi:hypothetical protein